MNAAPEFTIGFQYQRSTGALWAGLALIVLPLVGIALKFVSFGWMTAILMVVLVIPLSLAYALQIMVAAQGFLSKRDLFGVRRRVATKLSWVTLVAFLVACLAMPDGGDWAYGSTLQVLMGVYGDNAEAIHAASDWLMDWLTIAALLVWLVSAVWLFVEWIRALISRKKHRLAIVNIEA